MPAKTKSKPDETPAASPAAEGVATAALSGKDCERELKKLGVELVKLQLWVVHQGLRVCIVFEGRDGPGKGGTIKALTERVSLRVFRVVARSAGQVLLPQPNIGRYKATDYPFRYVPEHF